MNALPFISLLYYAIVMVCKASASCPCHIPCTNRHEICTCYGPCGDDGYGCQRHGDDYHFFTQIQCREGEWQVQCIRESQCSIQDTIDDTNPFAAYEQTANNMIESFDEEQEAGAMSSAAASYAWFGGNWFDFWGQNSAQFFGEDDNDQDMAANMKAKYHQYNDDITIDNPSVGGYDASQSTQRTLQQHVKSPSTHVLDDLGRNEAGYKIIALPLYILILCIVASAILGMLMCAGFVYCGLNCCCPLPPSSPVLSAQQRSNAVDMSRLMRSLTLGGGNKSYDTDNDGGIYHRMRNALHNPTNDEASSMLSNDEEDDEYLDSEDDMKEHIPTPGGFEYDDDHHNTRGSGVVVMEEKERKEPLALYGKCDSDIDQDSDDSMIEKLSNLIETQLFDPYSYNDIDIEEENENEAEETIAIGNTVRIDAILSSANEEMAEMQQMEEEESGQEEVEVTDYTEHEGTPLIHVHPDSANNYNSGSKSSALP